MVSVARVAAGGLLAALLLPTRISVDPLAKPLASVAPQACTVRTDTWKPGYLAVESSPMKLPKRSGEELKVDGWALQ